MKQRFQVPAGHPEARSLEAGFFSCRAAVWLAGLVLVATMAAVLPRYLASQKQVKPAESAAPVRGELIGSPIAPPNQATHVKVQMATSVTNQVRKPAPAPALAAADSQGFLSLPFAVLSDFPFAVPTPDPESDSPARTNDLRGVGQIPPDIKVYDGLRVKIKGYVLPLRTQGRGVTEFFLVRDLMSCCFGPQLQMNHWIHVTIKRGEFRPVISTPLTVYGTLQVGERFEKGSLMSIYRLQAEKVSDDES